MIRTVLLSVLAAFIFTGDLLAQDRHNPFARLSGREAEEREQSSLWYERADGRGMFIFDRTSEPALLWPDGGDEVIGLSPSRATGGGEVWVTDMDDVMLRFTNLGGVTYFPPDSPQGVAADAIGPGRTLVAAPASSDEVEAAARELVDELARISRTEVSAEISAGNRIANAYTIDAMRMILRAASSVSRSDLRDLSVVQIDTGDHPDVVYDSGRLLVIINPVLGYAGRPSSARIAEAILR